jgi:hypothetical protein
VHAATTLITFHAMVVKRHEFLVTITYYSPNTFVLIFLSIVANILYQPQRYGSQQYFTSLQQTLTTYVLFKNAHVNEKWQNIVIRNMQDILITKLITSGSLSGFCVAGYV